VLLIEDDQQLGELMSRILHGEGYQGAVAGDGIAGLTLALHGRFDLAIIDRDLPGMNGLELVRRLRGAETDTVIMVASARSRPVEIREAYDAGADDFLAKPFQITVLLEHIGALCADGESSLHRPIGRGECGVDGDR
jgi:two-component system response regulator QseB